MRAVLDTNILARAATPGDSPAREVFKRLSQPPHLVILSPFLLSELSLVMRYERVKRLHGLDEEGINNHLIDLQETALMVIPSTGPAAAVVPHDPHDDPVIATGVAGNADVLCTLDRHIRHHDVQAYCAAHGIRVLTDVELLQELRRIKPVSGS
jgi:putative PIN family toxin of toxin-antitoxin system